MDDVIYNATPCGYAKCSGIIDADRVARGVRYCDAVCKTRALTQRARQRHKAYVARLQKERDDAITTNAHNLDAGKRMRTERDAALHKIAELQSALAQANERARVAEHNAAAIDALVQREFGLGTSEVHGADI